MNKYSPQLERCLSFKVILTSDIWVALESHSLKLYDALLSKIDPLSRVIFVTFLIHMSPEDIEAFKQEYS